MGTLCWGLFTAGIYVGNKKWRMTEREASLLILPFVWLSLTTMDVVLLRLGVRDVCSEVLGLNKKVGKWMHRGSMGLFILANYLMFGFENSFVWMMVMWEVVRVVYIWLG